MIDKFWLKSTNEHVDSDMLGCSVSSQFDLASSFSARLTIDILALLYVYYYDRSSYSVSSEVSILLLVSHVHTITLFVSSSL